MKKVNKPGFCVECGQETNIILDDNKHYACLSCLNKVGQEQNRINEGIHKILSDMDEMEISSFLQKTIDILKVLEYNNCSMTEHCIKSLEAIDINIRAEFDEALKNSLEEFAKLLDF